MKKKNNKTNKKSPEAVNMESVNFENDPNPQIKVLGWKEQSDGSALMDYKVNNAFIKAYLKDTKRKKFTKDGLNKWVLAKLEQYVRGMNDEKTF